MTQRVRRIPAFPCFLVALAGWVGGVAAGSVPATARGPRPPHDLSGYDKAVADYSHSFQPSVVQADLENFILTHWKQRRRGFVVVRLVTPQGKDMANVSEQLFIEPLKNGSWCIRGSVQIDLTELRWAPASEKKPARHLTAQFEGVSLEVGGTYRHLILKDKAGKTIDSFWVGPRE